MPDLAEAVARRLGGDEQTACEVARLHGVGRAALPAELVRKREALTDDEADALRQGPEIAAAMAAAGPSGDRLEPAVRAAHERWDGTGYPDGLAGEDIPVASRIILACEAYLALREERSYRPALTDEEAVEVLRLNAGTQFCPHTIPALIEVLADSKVAVPPAAVATRERPPRLLSRPRIAAALAAGAALGLWIALPLSDVRDRCPPAGEGLAQCVLQKSWLPAVITVVGFAVAAFLVARAIAAAPGTYRRWKAGELRHRRPPPPSSDDIVLLAASRGLTRRDTGSAGARGRR